MSEDFQFPVQHVRCLVGTIGPKSLLEAEQSGHIPFVVREERSQHNRSPANWRNTDVQIGSKRRPWNEGRKWGLELTSNGRFSAASCSHRGSPSCFSEFNLWELNPDPHSKYQRRKPASPSPPPCTPGFLAGGGEQSFWNTPEHSVLNKSCTQEKLLYQSLT